MFLFWNRYISALSILHHCVYKKSRGERPKAAPPRKIIDHFFGMLDQWSFYDLIVLRIFDTVKKDLQEIVA